MGTSFDSSTFEREPLSNYIISNAEDKSCIDPNPDDIISNPHSNSYIDLNGDCHPDIFLTKVHKDEDGNEHFYNEIYL